jgi:hypothetical protein
MEVGNQLRREIKPASQVISPFQHDGGGYQGWESGSQAALRQKIDLYILRPPSLVRPDPHLSRKWIAHIEYLAGVAVRGSWQARPTVQVPPAIGLSNGAFEWICGLKLPHCSILRNNLFERSAQMAGVFVMSHGPSHIVAYVECGAVKRRVCRKD